MAMGKFALLHDDDSDYNADVRDDEPDEAPYAYEPAPLTPKEVVHEALGQYGALAEEDSEDEVDGSNKDAMSDIASDDDSQRHMDVQSAEGCHDDSVSRRDTTATYSPFPHKDETSARVTGQPNATTGQMGKETSAMVQTTLTSFVTSAGEVIETLRTAASPVAHAEDDFVPGSPDSQQEFTMGTTHRATPDGDHTEPIRVAQFLDSFDGYEVAVPAYGQCAMLALYATISNNSTRTLKNTATTVKQAGVIKRGIYALMLANLRRDVEVGQLDPVTVYHDLYPDHPLFDSKEAATAALYAHYEQERGRPTNAAVPSSFWACPHELRAIAQYLREPLLVLDVDRTGIATMQRYTYKVHRLQNGKDHESGCYEAFSHSQARDYMYACWSLHVLPYFMVRHVSERHFYGVAHGDTFVKWRAEGDNEYAANVSSSYTWKGTVNYLRPEEDSDLESLNKLANLDNVNSVIIKRLPMRERLDIVYARLGLPTLDAVGYDDEEDLERTIAAEGRILQEALGIDGYASGSQASQDGTGMDIVLPVRYPRASSGEVVENAYFRLLRAPEGEEIDKEDYGQYKLFTAANAEAFSKWCSLYRSRLEIPATRRRSNPRTIAPWLLEHVGALRHLFAFLPYPELEAKQWASENLYQWGAVEAFREQSDAIWRIKNDTAVAHDARELCTFWHSAISKGPDSTRYTLAGAVTDGQDSAE
ncbi:hypothetical protein PF010_g6333 [Phytophthora fragariae]|uniref:Uncharacterized protein n=1 Tax=Phytophthora fragariae TaxID=53985 RepID=A0A6A3FDT3_9STRA|nr:hypothetical protein PF009_g8117 [Phytophthora fragariae]KAE9123600.1 hypothetical protein PF010_g6333 [Phytophthora fragariae]